MLFNSIDFLIFFPVVTLIYLIIPARFRQFWLLVTSYWFYMNWNPKYGLLLLFSTAATWLCGIGLEKAQTKGRRKLFLAICFLANLGILFYFKYFNFGIESINAVLHTQMRTFDIVLPVGISFFTFQALGYTVDVYRGDIRAERNFIRYALFVSFFPQLVAGPIERSGNMMHQIREVPFWSRKQILQADRIRDGLILMVWGMFLKVVIADRISTLVDTVFDRYYAYGSVALVMAAVGFGLQIYCDFSSYSIIAVGSAKVMGFQLMENFNAPYMATSVTEFWRRWHISLSTWFRDYLYIPLGGNRKGKARKLLNLLITFTVSGLWHGANWTFVFWGFLHGIYLVLENLLRPAVRKINARYNVKTGTTGYRICRAVVTFVLVDFAWIFFRADSMHQALGFIRHMFTQADLWVLSGNAVYTYGLTVNEMSILCWSLLLLLFVDLIRVRRGVMLDTWLRTQWTGFRIVFVLFILFATVIFGVYGPGFDSKQFIYFQF